MSNPKKARALIVYPYLFHYRFGVFKALEERDDLDLVFVSDVEGRKGIAATSPRLFKEHHRVKTITRSRFTWQVGLLYFVATQKYDSVIFHGDVWSISTWVAAAIARLRQRRVFFWTIGWHRPDPAVIAQLRVSFYRLAHELLVYGNTGRDIGILMGYPRSRMHVIYNSHESSQQIAHEGQDPVVQLTSHPALTVGAVIRLTAIKRLDLLIDAVAHLARRGSSVRVILAGEGPERESLERLAARRGIDAVFTGAIYSKADLRSFYEAVDVTVVPAAAGLTVIQSLSQGVPVVTDDDEYGQMPEAEAVVEGVTGGRYRKGDVDELASTIMRVAAAVRRDPEASASRARQEVEARWTPAAQCAKINERIQAAADRTGLV